MGFDRIAIALQQRSEERESFLKELDKNWQMIRGSTGSRRWWRRERSFSRTRRLCTLQKRLDGRILKDRISCDDDKDYDNNLLRRLQRWMLIHKNPGQHSTFGFESWRGNYGLHQDERRAKECMLAELQEAAQTGCKGLGAQTVCAAGQERERSERQALHSRGSFIPVAGRGEKLVGVTCCGRWDVCKKSSRL